MKKEKIDYFEHFITVAGIAEKQAELLNRIVENYDVSKLDQYIQEMHSLEHNADFLKNQMVTELVRDFLPPIDREDIMMLADLYDSVCDSIDDVLLRIYMYNIREMRDDVQIITQRICKICNELGKLTGELRNFKSNEKLLDLVMTVNDIEEEGDKLYIDATHRLYVEEEGIKTISAWTNIYTSLEDCYDSCELVADEIKTVIIKNC
jgi:predicted phosphate transport protein (TIGR00153 family)